MSRLTQLIAGFGLIVLFTISVRGEEPSIDEDCNIVEHRDKVPFPNIFDAKDPAFPFTPTGYEISMEVNRKPHSGKGSSNYVFETLDYKNKKGRIELQYLDGEDKKQQTIVYFFGGETKESFTVNYDKFECVDKADASVYEAYDFGHWTPEALEEDEALAGFSEVFGPSAILRQGWLMKDKPKYVGKTELRGNKDVKVWKACIPRSDGKKTVLKYYFSGDNNQIPMRVDVATSGSVKLTYVIGYFKQLIAEPKITIPFGFGCQRLVMDKVTLPEVFLEKDYRLAMEVVTTAVGDDTDTEHISSTSDNAEIVYLKDYELISYTQTIMDMSKLDENPNIDRFRYQTKQVIDLDEGLVYETELTTSECKIRELDEDFNKYIEKLEKGEDVSDVEIEGEPNDDEEEVDDDKDGGDDKEDESRRRKRAADDDNDADDEGEGDDTPKKEKTEISLKLWDVLPPFRFMDGSKFRIFDSALWMPGNFLNYLGTTIERGIPCKVFEETYDDKFKDDEGKPRTVVVTRLYMEDSVQYDSIYMSKGAPVKIILTVYNSERTSFERVITLNVHSFNSGILELDKPAVFDVKPCFKEPHQSTWFQIVFPLDYMLNLELMTAQNSPKVEMALRRELGDIPPHRLPKIYMDYDSDQIYMTVQLLERPLYTATFDSEPLKELVPQDPTLNTESFLSESPADCSRFCLLNAACNAFSHCDNLMCNLFIQNIEDKDKVMNTTDNVGCTLYTRKVRGDLKNPQTWSRMVNEGILADLNMQISGGEFDISMSMPDSDGNFVDRKIKAGKLIKDIEPGFFIGKLWQRDISRQDYWGSVLSRYSVAKDMSKFNYQDDEGKIKPGFAKISRTRLRLCAKRCDDDDDCNSFSFCAGNEGECIFSNLHGDQIKGDEIVDGDRWKCAIVQKMYLGDFDRFFSFSLHNEAKKAIDVKSIEACAKACIDESSFSCRSFDYCTDESKITLNDKCLLHVYHVSANRNQKSQEKLQLNFNTNSTSCLHYSRRFSADFTKTKNSKFAAATGIHFDGKELSLESCSHHCADVAGSNCQAFEFCESVLEKSIRRTCRMTSDRSSVKSVEKSTTCSVFLKEWQDSSQSQGISRIFNRKYSSQLSGWMSIFLLLVGAAISAAVYHFKFANNN